MSDTDPVTFARELARKLAATARDRDRLGGTPRAERALIRDSGLLKLVIPREWGGSGAAWPTVMRVTQILAAADASIAQVFGMHHVLLATSQLFGTPQQARRLHAGTVANNWFWGNALNPLDPRLAVVTTRTGRVLCGDKSFATGSIDFDMMIVSAIEDETGKLIVAAIPTSRAGIRLNDDWDNMGQRQTDSGSASFADVALEDDEILGPPGPNGSTLATVRVCIPQLTFAHTFLGIAEGALAAAREFVRTRTRPWHSAKVDNNTQDPYVLEHFGDMVCKLAGAQAVADRAAIELDATLKLGDAITPDDRGRLAVSIATAKVLATRAVLDITSQIFEVTGASGTGGAWGFDRFWRNARTLTLHDRVDYKVHDIGQSFLNDQWPAPSFYS
ncbi:MAG TPA: acyl-CoA dehydrogenase family protein [Kofleriaceae bacterium]|nr:acyl-CoA dehydrogenase family protein [Kofleriaceae bacterium]